MKGLKDAPIRPFAAHALSLHAQGFKGMFSTVFLIYLVPLRLHGAFAHICSRNQRKNRTKGTVRRQLTLHTQGFKSFVLVAWAYVIMTLHWQGLLTGCAHEASRPEIFPCEFPRVEERIQAQPSSGNVPAPAGFKADCAYRRRWTGL